MPLEVEAELERLLCEEKIAWLTTVRSDGTPQPTPVWFLWQQGTFLIYSQPEAKKIRNIANEPRVALNLNTDPGAIVSSSSPGRRPSMPTPPLRARSPPTSRNTRKGSCRSR